MYCKYLSKTLKNDFKCKLYKRQVIYQVDCKNCSDFILTTNKHIKKVSKKRKFVSAETYQKVFERDKGQCRLCEASNDLQLHHILYRSERPDLIDEPSNCIMLCGIHHRLAHSNKHLWQPILLGKVKEKENE